MSRIDILFNSMALFWIFVQQVCLCFIKWAYEDIMGRAARVRVYMVMHALFFAFLLILGFDLFFELNFVYRWLPKRAFFFYGRLKWNFFCEIMLILDALLVAYAWRVYRLYMRAPQTPFEPSDPMRVCLQDIALSALFLAPFLWYHVGMTKMALWYSLSDPEVRVLQLFFIKFTNFFYALFEGTVAVLLWRIYRSVRKEGIAAHGE